jgi:hypothetical protein
MAFSLSPKEMLFMLSTKRISFSITGKHASHWMYRLATIITPICLCIAFSGCFTAPAQTNQVNKATSTRTITTPQPTNTPVVRPTATTSAKTVDQATPTTQAVPKPQVAPTSTRVLNGTATVWTDSNLFPGPATHTVSITNQINNSTGAVTASFAPFTLTNPSTGKTITVSLPPGTTATGQFNATTGSLTLTSPLLLQNVPVAGTVTTRSTTLATDNTITIPDGTQISGKPLNASNNITLVGNTSFKVAFVTVNVQMRITGILEPAN